MKQSVRELMRQPIPPLTDTLTACMRSVSPLLNGMQRLKAKLMLDLYGAAQAKQQQRLLALAREQSTNWCAEGLTRMWLSCRGGLPFTNNYVLLLQDDPQADSLSGRAARLMVAALTLHQRVHDRQLVPDMAANLPLAMEQYRRCFATHRLPRAECDEMVTVDGTHHVAVLANGQVYCVAVDQRHGPLAVKAVQDALDQIIGDTGILLENDQTAPSLFSALPRGEWAQVRTTLCKDEHNSQALSILEKALFVLCLDNGAAPGSLSGISATLRDGNHFNRYYDKSMQIIVMENGKAGLCFERAAVDGSVALGFAARLQQTSVALAADEAVDDTARARIRTRAVPWRVSPELTRRLQRARQTIAEARNQRGIESWVSTGIGARGLKALQLSPDATVQLALQVAIAEVTGRPLNIVEPVQTRHFAGGRMDFIAPVTAEAVAAVEALRSADGNAYRSAAAVRRALKAHQNLVLRAKSGRGLMAHLLALNAVQSADDAHKGWGLHDWQHGVFSHLDKGLKMLARQDVLASNGSGFEGVTAFGPIGPRPHMISIGYVIGDDQITFDLRADGRFNAHGRALRGAIENALRKISKLLEQCGQPHLH